MIQARRLDTRIKLSGTVLDPAGEQISLDAASLWLTIVSDSEEKVELAISSNIAHGNKSMNTIRRGGWNINSVLPTI